jgi:hypothetical protein
MAHPVDDNPSRVIAYLIETNGSKYHGYIILRWWPISGYSSNTYVHCFAYVLTPVFLQNIGSGHYITIYQYAYIR